MYLSEFPQNHTTWGLTFLNPAADWRIVVHIAGVSTSNRICLTFYSVINYNAVTYALSSYEYGRNITFTGV